MWEGLIIRVGVDQIRSSESNIPLIPQEQWRSLLRQGEGTALDALTQLGKKVTGGSARGRRARGGNARKR